VLERGSPFCFPEVGVYVPLCPVKADLSGGILKRYRTGAMPARSECPYPELAEHMRGSGSERSASTSSGNNFSTKVFSSIACRIFLIVMAEMANSRKMNASNCSAGTVFFIQWYPIFSAHRCASSMVFVGVGRLAWLVFLSVFRVVYRDNSCKDEGLAGG